MRLRIAPRLQAEIIWDSLNSQLRQSSERLNPQTQRSSLGF